MNALSIYRRCLPLLLGSLMLGAGGRHAAAQGVVEAAMQDVAVLAAPEMKGRGYTFGGHEKAAAWIRQQFTAIGLQPPAGGYEQPFEMEADVFPEAPVLAVDGAALRLGRDFIPFSASGSGQVETHRVVDAGYGLVLPEKAIDAYDGKQVEGAVVVVRAGAPAPVRADPAVPAEALSEEMKIELATRRGARAVLLLVDGLMYGTTAYNARIPVLEVRAGAWPQQAGHVALNVESVQDERVVTRNIVGLLPGTVHPDSTVLLMAHYDHHGALGEDFYFPGANDNASGVALLLALARYFKAHPLPYTLVFIAFSGEEKGLLGSRHFVAHPVVDLDKAKFLFNFDMVASGEQGITAVGGADFDGPYAVLDSINTVLAKGPLGKRKNAPNSDHYFFIERGIPGFFLYTKGGSQPYHHAGDVPATLEWDDFMHVYELARRFLAAL